MFKKISRWYRRPKDPAGYVYYVRLKTSDGPFYKLGFTSKSSLVERMAYGNSGDENLIDRQLVFTFRHDAWDVEQTLLDHFDKYRAFGKYSRDPTKPLCGRGQSELFANDILGLDDELYAAPSEEKLKEWEEENEQAKDGCLMILIGLVLAPFTFGLSLFFIIGGLSGFWSIGKSHRAGVVGQTRPKHPPTIQDLVDSISNGKNVA
ncbi:hypothetical protein [Halomonas maura]|uniref:hypothetical protein n=1 Tax=Halomonas maura TaxID=117606 RepID=UPI0025B4F6D2|nr:hypothetical protein [Halomonas maura]MDN3555535.1 hypothetical protein [Halomonas maura]